MSSTHMIHLKFLVKGVVFAISLILFSAEIHAESDPIIYDDYDILAALDPGMKETIESMSPEMRKLQLDTFRYGILIAEYVEVVDKTVVLKITKEQAQKIGVPTSVYIRFISEFESFNKSIQEMEAQGVKVEIPNIKDSMTLLKNKIEAARLSKK